MTTPRTRREREEALLQARRVIFRLARDSGASIHTRPMSSSAAEPTVRDAEPLAGARAARDLELAARGAARDYIRRAREAGHTWDQLAQALGLAPGDAAYTYAANSPDTEAPWRQGSFGWTCRSCDQQITDLGLLQGPADSELGHAGGCPRLAAAIAAWDARPADRDAEWEAGQ